MDNVAHGRNCHLLKRRFFFTFFFPGAFCRRPGAAGVWRRHRPETMKERRFRTATAEASTPVPKGQQRRIPVIRPKIKRKKRRGADPGLQGICPRPPGSPDDDRPPGRPTVAEGATARVSWHTARARSGGGEAPPSARRGHSCRRGERMYVINPLWPRSTSCRFWTYC